MIAWLSSLWKKKQPSHAQLAFDRILESDLYVGDTNLPMMEVLKLFRNTMPRHWVIEAQAKLDTIIRVFPGALSEYDVLLSYQGITSPVEFFERFDEIVEDLKEEHNVQFRGDKLPLKYEPFWLAQLECGARVVVSGETMRICGVDQQARPDASAPREIDPRRIVSMQRAVRNPFMPHGFESWSTIESQTSSNNR